MLPPWPCAIGVSEGVLSLFNDGALDEPNRFDNVNSEFNFEFGAVLSVRGTSLILFIGKFHIEVEGVREGDTLKAESDSSYNQPRGNVNCIYC